MNIAPSTRLPLWFLCVACAQTPTTAPMPGAIPAAPTGAAGATVTAASAAFQLPALEPGFQRLMASAVEVPAGTSNDWMQWVGGPTDQDYDVSEMKGAQSAVGHHAILYTTTLDNPIGFTRLWSETDQLTTQTVGGLGAEGAIPVPAGVVLRVKQGTYLVFDVHYLNPTEATQMGQTYMDVKFAPANPANVLASRIASSSLMISLPAHQTVTLDLMCKISRDLSLLRFTNHMHEYGRSALTEVIDPMGRTQMIKADPVWSSDWSLSPNYTFYPLEAPLRVPVGSVLHTRCEWNNTTDQPIAFPKEMCAFSGLILGDTDITCLDGQTL